MDKDGLGLTESYWYQANLTEGDCSGKKLYFAVFEDCRLTNLDFKAADLTGARFRKCRIENCNFETANLSSAYFENCYWEDPNFKNAVMTHTLFTEEGIPQDELDEEQLGAILVKGGREL